MWRGGPRCRRFSWFPFFRSDPLAPSTPTCEPDALYIGDTAHWTKTIPDYPSTDGWTLAYSFRGPTGIPARSATPSGSGYDFVFPATVTTTMAAGTYEWAARVSKAGEVHTVGRGVFTAVAVASIAKQSHEETVLAVIEAAIEGRLTADLQQYAINGRQVTKIPIKELVALRARYQRKIWKLRNPGKIGVPVAVAFTPPDGQVGTPEPVSLPPWFRYGG